MSFLGLCGYCRSFVPNVSVIEKPLCDLIHRPDLTVPSLITWSEGLPDPTKPFIQAVDEREGCMTSVLSQKHGSNLRPVAYFSVKVDPVAAGPLKCLRATAAAVKGPSASRDLVGYALLTLLVPHAVLRLSWHLSAARYLRYHTCLLDMPNVTVKHCNTLNPTSLNATSSRWRPP